MRRLLQSTPLRLTLVLVALFSAVSLASLAVSYRVARSTIETTIHDGLVQDLAGYLATPSSVAVATLVEAQGRVMSPSDRVIGYRDPFGRLFGNGAIVRTEAGFEVVALDRDNPVARKYFILTQPVHGGYLTLAASADTLVALRQTMTIVLLVSLLPTILIALAGGVLLARRSAARLDAIEGTLSELTSGNLAARVPVMPGGDDDLSLIGRRIDRMASAQEENVAALRQVSADIAHDLKTPIQRLAVLLERAADAKPDTIADLIAAAQDETRGMSETFQSLLQIARIEGGGTPREFRKVDLGRLAANIGDLYAPSADEAGIVLSVTADAPGEVDADSTLLGQLLSNLVENALRHAVGAGRIDIAVTGRRIVVADDGPGIPEAEREAVLRRLYRREASRSTPGAGLGLALVKAIADLHGATLVLGDNAPGLRVTLTFP